MSSTRPFKCSECPSGVKRNKKSFVDSTQLEQHRQLYHTELDFYQALPRTRRCTLKLADGTSCGFRSTNIFFWRTHGPCNKFPGKVVNGVQVEFKCNVVSCRRWFSSRAGLGLHLSRVHYTKEDAAYICKPCGVHFVTKSALLIHYSKKHLVIQTQEHREMKQQEQQEQRGCPLVPLKVPCTESPVVSGSFAMVSVSPSSPPHPGDDMMLNAKEPQQQVSVCITIPDHDSLPLPPGRVACPVCHVVYSLPTLRPHMKAVHDQNRRNIKAGKQYVYEEPNLKCNKCRKSFTKLHNLRQHYPCHPVVQTPSGEYLCGVKGCKVTRKQLHRLGDHRNRVHFARQGHSFFCLYCPKSFCVEKDAISHVAMYHNGHICGHKGCAREFHTRRERINHEKVHDPNEEQNGIQRASYSSYCRYEGILYTKEPFHRQCDGCGKSFKSPSSYRAHIRCFTETRFFHDDIIARAKQEQYQCPFPGCKLKFKSISNVGVHICHHYKDTDYRFQCRFCQRRFYSAARAMGHIGVHHVQQASDACLTLKVAETLVE